MGLILNIETSTKNCSVAISDNQEIISFKELMSDNYSHSENLTVFIQDIIADANINFADLSAIAVSMGPGSYTGLRIGVATAKGLCKWEYLVFDHNYDDIDNAKKLAEQLDIKFVLRQNVRNNRSWFSKSKIKEVIVKIRINIKTSHYKVITCSLLAHSH